MFLRLDGADVGDQGRVPVALEYIEVVVLEVPSGLHPVTVGSQTCVYRHFFREDGMSLRARYTTYPSVFVSQSKSRTPRFCCPQYSSPVFGSSGVYH